MKKAKKLNLSKNKILILLSAILVLFIGLLTISIFIQTKHFEPTIADIETQNQQTNTIDRTAETNEKTAKKQKKQKQSHILRSENGKMIITSSGKKEQQKQSELIETQNQQGEPSIDAVTAEVSGLTQTVPLTAIPAPVAENDQLKVLDQQQIEEAAARASQNTVQENLLETNSEAVVAKAEPQTNKKVSVAGVPLQTNGTLIFVFDDAGHNLHQLQPFLELPFPVTVAVLPGLEYSVQAAQKIRSCGKELLLHQPMQAKNKSTNPGPGAIEPNMTADQVYELVRENLAEIGPVSGINNHEGSLITENETLLGAVMDVCRSEEIYFIDSRTTSASVARKVANQRNLPIWERTVFLDNTQNRKDIETAVRLGMEMASKNGSAIMIGHVWTEILPSVLTDLYPEMIMQGYSISTISKSRSKITGN